MIIGLLAAGPTELLPRLDEYKKKIDLWVGVDRGVHTLLEHGITPDAAFGDFDSVTTTELETIQSMVSHLAVYPSEKDETDLEIAFKWAFSQHPVEVHLLGATGGRMDHFIGNMQLLLNDSILKRSSEIGMYIVDQKNIITVKTPGTYRIEANNEKKYISFLPALSDVSGMTLTGFKYPLTDACLTMGSSLCISNELILEYGNFSFTDGILFVVRSSD